MSVDTAEKRFSMLDFDIPTAPGMPPPVGGLAAPERLAYLWLYSGISAGITATGASVEGADTSAGTGTVRVTGTGGGTEGSDGSSGNASNGANDTHDPVPWYDHQPQRRKPKARRDTPEWWREIDAERALLRAQLERIAEVARDEVSDVQNDGITGLPDGRASDTIQVVSADQIAEARRELRKLDRAIRDEAARRADTAVQAATAQVAELMRLAYDADADEEDEIAVLMMVM